MADFPLLSSRAVVQYPTPLVVGRQAHVIQFLDGSDQRFAARGIRLRSWQIQLTLLNENETAALEAFFEEQGGEYQTFTFPDPIGQLPVPNCVLGSPTFTTSYLATDIGSTSFWVLETAGNPDA
jgi:phage-related protein